MYVGEYHRDNPYNLKSGDILAFSSCSFVSMVISLGQCSLPYLMPNHVGIVCKYGNRLVLFESLMSFNRPCLIQNKITAGVQAQDIRLRVASHPGKVWKYPLKKELSTHDRLRLGFFLYNYIGCEYDLLGAFRSREYSFVEKFLHRQEDLNRLFCSEYCAAALAHVDVINTIESNRYNPKRLCRELIAQGAVDRNSVVQIS